MRRCERCGKSFPFFGERIFDSILCPDCDQPQAAGGRCRLDAQRDSSGGFSATDGAVPLPTTSIAGWLDSSITVLTLPGCLAWPVLLFLGHEGRGSEAMEALTSSLRSLDRAQRSP